MHKVGFIGWRGMVGSVLMERMRDEQDFTHLLPHFFTTSQAGQPGPDAGHGVNPLLDAADTTMLSQMDIIVSCQGSDFTNQVYNELQKQLGRLLDRRRLSAAHGRGCNYRSGPGQSSRYR